MRILSVNKFYHVRGGSERYLFDLNRLLVDRGHDVVPFSMVDEANIPTEYDTFFVSAIDFFDKMSLADRGKAAARVIYSTEARRNIEALIDDTRPQLAHLHNIAHQISPSILHSLKKYQIPVVQTLHDYKLICPTYSLLAQNEVCERCLGGRYYNAALQRCNHQALLPSLLNSVEMYIHGAMRIYRGVDLFIAPSKFLRAKVIEGGLEPHRIEHLPYFVHLGNYRPDYDHQGYLLFFGRLVPSKGVDILLEALRHLDRTPLIIVGDGELRSRLEGRAAEYGLDVSFVGHQSGPKLHQLVRESMAVIVPSRWYENLPYAIIEAFALGKAVIGANIGGIPELIEPEINGLLFEPGNALDLAAQLRWILSHKQRLPEMGRQARMKVERHFAPQDHYQRITEIFQRYQ